ncbi:hypothetical protein BCU68_04975 [Vibrio sp. 10N.286.49.B3]|uniref:flagellar hook-length control protein FliK n=1 Tax=Vibrio sp. 10N.286.49.B3 TaxID=1880855 RepID=UPI000CAE93D6|nr:flagellar hook-length control protein FliK [Vibrio sp. 10N.286.49.B3]PMH41036.1 hypothetical protein BCU68_04975 [Vibrio sp. 10N.286.49.B3]
MNLHSTVSSTNSVAALNKETPLLPSLEHSADEQTFVTHLSSALQQDTHPFSPVLNTEKDETNLDVTSIEGELEQSPTVVLEGEEQVGSKADTEAQVSKEPTSDALMDEGSQLLERLVLANKTLAATDKANAPTELSASDELSIPYELDSIDSLGGKDLPHQYAEHEVERHGKPEIEQHVELEVEQHVNTIPWGVTDSDQLAKVSHHNGNVLASIDNSSDEQAIEKQSVALPRAEEELLSDETITDENAADKSTVDEAIADDKLHTISASVSQLATSNSTLSNSTLAAHQPNANTAEGSAPVSQTNNIQRTGSDPLGNATSNTAQTFVASAASSESAPAALIANGAKAELIENGILTTTAATIKPTEQGVLALQGSEGEESLSQLSAATSQQLAPATQQQATRAEIQAAQQVPLQLTKELANEQVAEKVQIMMSKNLKNLDIRLDPPELGRMSIRLNMNNDSASLHITVSNSQARDIIEQTLPRLRDMLAQQGVQLSDSSVSQQNSGQQGQASDTGSDHHNEGNHTSQTDDNEAETQIELSVDSKQDGISYYA